jgi:hypothetical protein
MKTFLSALLLLTIAAAPMVARADSFTTFDTSGIFQSGGTFSGTFTLDTTNSMITAFDVVLNTDGFNNLTVTERSNYGSHDWALGNFQSNQASFALVVTNSSTDPLLCTVDSPCSNDSGETYGGIAYDGGFNVDNVLSGTPALTPEPSSLVLFGTGLLGLLVVSLRRRGFAPQEGATAPSGVFDSQLREQRPA